MKVPLAWLRQYVELPTNAHRVADMLATMGFPVESIDERPQITGVLVGRIRELEKHPNADRLQVGTIDVGNGRLLTIATAATNVARGQTIGVATIGAQLPALRIERRKMRGVESEGMMISAEELALPPEWFEDGIMQLDDGVPLGSELIDVFGLGEAVLEVEVTGNRVDAMSMLGIARELAAYQGVPLRMPALDYAASPSGDGAPRVTIDSTGCRRFVVQRFTQITVARSPAWMRVRLALAGQRPINNIVDISNYVMLEIGQPLHFYDDQRIAHHHLIVRDARAGETLTTLDGEEHELSDGDLLIASERGIEGLAGLKGGARSEVTDKTHAILLESATFAGARVRRMSTRLALRTDASTRHEKGSPRVLTDLGAARAAHLLAAQGAAPHPPLAFGEPVAQPPPIEFDRLDLRRLLGYELTMAQAVDYLDRLGFKVQPTSERHARITPPLLRPDVSESADVVEEIARVAGYDRIEASVPAVAQHEIASTAFEVESALAHALAALGYREVVNVALHGAQTIERWQRAGLAVPRVVEVNNPLSEDQRFLRFALEPSFLEYFSTLHEPAAVFEIAHTFEQGDGEIIERAVASFAFTASPIDEPPWRDTRFLRLKGDAEAVLHAVSGRVFTCVASHGDGWHPGKCAAVRHDGRHVATIAQIHPRLAAAFNCNLPVYACRIEVQALPPYTWPTYRPRPKYPSTYRDLALVCEPNLSASALEQAICAAIGPLCTQAHTFDEYRGPQIEAGKKSLAVRVTLVRADATITDEEADAAIARALTILQTDLDVRLRT